MARQLYMVIHGHTWLYPNFIYPHIPSKKHKKKQPENGSKFHDLIQQQLAASKALIWSRSQAIETMEDSCTAAEHQAAGPAASAAALMQLL